MSWFKDLSTRAKLFIGFGLVILLLAAVIVAAIRNVTSMEETRDEIFYHEFANSTDVLTMKAKLESARVGLFTMMAAGGRAEQETQRAMIKEVSASIDSLFRALYERNRDEPEITRLVEGLERTYADYRDLRDRQLLPLVYSGKKDQAMSMAMGVQADRYAKMASLVSELEGVMKAKALGHISDSSQEASR